MVSDLQPGMKALCDQFLYCRLLAPACITPTPYSSIYYLPPAPYHVGLRLLKSVCIRCTCMLDDLITICSGMSELGSKRHTNMSLPHQTNDLGKGKHQMAQLWPPELDDPYLFIAWSDLVIPSSIVLTGGLCRLCSHTWWRHTH